MRLLPMAFVSAVLTVLSTSASADQVVPSDRVTSGVTIRAAATTNSASLGILRPGESLPWVQNVPRWREVQLSPTQTGFVSKSWTRHIVDAPLAPRDQDELRIHYLPVGAGTCTVVECPGHERPRR